MIRKSHIAAALLLTSAFAAAPASADPACHTRHGIVGIEITGGPSCASPIFCAIATFRGGLRGTSDFTGTSLIPTVDTPTTGIVMITGDNVIHTAEGDIYVEDAIVFNTGGKGEFAEVGTIVGGTGDYAGATGHLQALGENLEGSFVVEICTP